MAVCWKPPSTMREPGSCAAKGGRESRESAKASAFPARSRAMASSTEAAAEIERTRGGADGRRLGDADDAHIRPVDLGDRLDAGGGAGEIGAFDHEIGRPEVDALLALLVDRHEADVDRAGFG